MKDIEEIAQEIVGREGGYVNDPDDPGGATKYGVTIDTMRRLGKDLDGDGQVTTSDVKRLSKADAVDIFWNTISTDPGSRSCRKWCRPASLTCMSMQAATRCAFFKGC